MELGHHPVKQAVLPTSAKQSEEAEKPAKQGRCWCPLCPDELAQILLMHLICWIICLSISAKFSFPLGKRKCLLILVRFSSSMIRQSLNLPFRYQEVAWMLPLLFLQTCHLLSCLSDILSGYQTLFRSYAILWEHLDSRPGTHMDLCCLYSWGTSLSKWERQLSTIISNLPVLSVQTDSFVTSLKQSLRSYANICRNIFTIVPLTVPGSIKANLQLLFSLPFLPSSW